MATEPLGTIAEIVMGQSPAGETCNDTGSGLPLLNGPTEFGSHHPVPVQYTSDPRKKAKRGDILFCVRGSTTGRMNWADREYAIGRGIAAIRHKRGSEYQHFLRGLLDFRLSELLAQATGSTFPNISYDQLANLPWHTRNEADQRTISQILGGLDDKIELNRVMNATLEALVHTVFKSWFVNVAESNLPKGWRQGTLGEVAENPRRSIQPDQIESSTPYIGLEHMPRRCIALSQWGIADDLESNKLEFKKNELLFGKLRPYFHKVGVAALDGVCSTDILVIAPKDPAWFGFVLGHISSVELVNHTDAASTGTKMPRTNWNDVSRFEVALPPESLAAEFTERIRPLIDRIITNIHESHTLAVLREALLPKLLSGELRLPLENLPQEKQAEFNIVPMPVRQPEKPSRKTTDEFVEAVMIAQLVKLVASPQFPLGRKRYNKYAYLAHRKVEDNVTEHYLKKAAGPYSPWAKYQGPEGIASKNGYIKNVKVGELSGFVPGENITDIDRYVPKYPCCTAVVWVVSKFRFRKNDDLELLATVDYAALDLIGRKQPVSFEGVKHVIATNKEWAAKLKREIFSDGNIKRALTELLKMFPGTYAT